MRHKFSKLKLRPRILSLTLWLFGLILGWALIATGQSLKILQTTDIHGRFHADSESDRDGGWLKLATIIEEIRQRAGAENTLLIDCGDTIQGSLTAAHSRGEIAVAMLNHLNYDVWVPGNHELDYGVRRLAELIPQVDSVVLNGNLRLHPPEQEINLPATRVFERGGLRIAVIGANSGFLNHWFWGEHVQDFSVESAVSMLDREMTRLRNKPDIDLIILAIHQGLTFRSARGGNEIVDIVQRFPDIDLILGGHIHREIAGRKLNNRVWYVQPGAHAEALAVVNIEYDPASRKISNITSSLRHTTEATPLCPKAEEALAPWLQPAQEYAEEIITNLKTPIKSWGRPGRSSQTSELLSRAIAAATGAEAVIHGRLSRADLPKGPVTRKDLFRLVPYENSLGVIKLNRRELVAVLEEQADMHPASAACGVYGLFVELNQKGEVIRLLDRNETDLPKNTDKLYSAAFNSYTLAGAGDRFPVLRRIVRKAEEEGRVRDTGIMTRDAVEDYLRQNPDPQVKAVQWLQQK